MTLFFNLYRHCDFNPGSTQCHKDHGTGKTLGIGYCLPNVQTKGQTALAESIALPVQIQ